MAKMKVRDMEKGRMYQWMYMGNQCVGHVTFKGSSIVRCHYVVGMWTDSDLKDQGKDCLAVDVNLKEYELDISNIMDAGIEQTSRYKRVVKAYNDEITRMNEEYKKEPKHSNWVTSTVSCNKTQDNYNTIGEALGESELVRPELIDPTDDVARLQKGFTVLGKIDLDSLDAKTRPTKKTKEEKRLEREEKARRDMEVMKEYKKRQIEEEMKAQELREKESNEERLHRLGEQIKIERNHDVSPHYTYGASGHSYDDEEIIRFKTGCHEGIAVGMVNQYTGERGYYVAMNLLGDNQVILHGVTLPDSTVAGHWSLSRATYVTQPNKMEIQMGQQFLLNTYLSHIDAVKEQNRIAFEAEQERIRKEEEERKAREEEERKVREEAERKAKEEEERKANEQSIQPIFTSDDDEETEVVKCLDHLAHIPYLRDEKNLLDNREWPLWDDVPQDDVVTKLCGLHLLSQIVSTMKANKRTDKICRTYIISSSYLDEMRRRKKDYVEEYENFAAILGTDVVKRGVLTYRQADSMYTLMFRVSVSKNGKETVKFALFINNVLFITDHEDVQTSMFRNQYQKRVCYIHSLRDKLDSFCVGTIGLILTFLAMEDDSKRIIDKQTNGSNMASGLLMRSNAANPDVDVRDATWYTNIFVNKTINVDSYKSHRWMGSGEDKHLEEVQVSAYTKGGYTMKAKVAK